MVSGSTNVKPLQAKGVTIWDEWADENGDLGPVYGKQWRSWAAPGHSVGYSEFVEHGKITKPIDQLSDLIKRINERPEDRRLIVSAWNPADVPDMKLPPCHMMFQCYVRGDRLDLKMYQRSADMFLGVPFNIASYALLTRMIANVCYLLPGRLIISFGDAHIYLNHIEQVKEQLSREPRELPVLRIQGRKPRSIDSFKFEDFELDGYDPHPAIKAPVSV